MPAAGLLNEVIVISQPGTSAKSFFGVRGGCHLIKSTELMDLGIQVNLPFSCDLGDTAKKKKRSFNMI